MPLSRTGVDDGGGPIAFWRGRESPALEAPPKNTTVVSGSVAEKVSLPGKVCITVWRLTTAASLSAVAMGRLLLLLVLKSVVSGEPRGGSAAGRGWGGTACRWRSKLSDLSRTLTLALFSPLVPSVEGLPASSIAAPGELRNEGDRLLLTGMMGKDCRRGVFLLSSECLPKLLQYNSRAFPVSAESHNKKERHRVRFFTSGLSQVFARWCFPLALGTRDVSQ